MITNLCMDLCLKLRKVTMWADTRERYRDQVKQWAGSMGWAVSRDKPSRQDRSSVGGYIVIQRNCD